MTKKESSERVHDPGASLFLYGHLCLWLMAELRSDCSPQKQG